ncbi:hypothetical protein FGO68_gene6664 [Halteria grandinella]|uniref:Peptidase A1 domain-containing protein n=1 Tax=Halteria grandinella TaxID=5974 RepID=A0A8J8T2D5_HALGN|nr:hypothetical protein FGO68_gene6664 [Halteria grandinella]
MKYNPIEKHSPSFLAVILLLTISTATSYQVSAPSGYYKIPMDVNNDQFNFIIGKVKILVLPLINFNTVVVANWNASFQLKPGRSYDADSSLSRVAIDPEVSQQKVNFISPVNSTLTGTIQQDLLCPKGSDLCSTKNGEGATQFFLTWAEEKGDKFNFDGTSAILGLGQSARNSQIASFTEQVLRREGLDRFSISYTTQFDIINFYIGYFNTEIPQDQQLQMETISQENGQNLMWGVSCSRMFFQGKQVEFPDQQSFFLTIEPLLGSSYMYFPSNSVKDQVSNSILTIIQQELNETAYLKTVDTASIIYFPLISCLYIDQSKNITLDFTSFKFNITIKNLLIINDCYLNLKLLYTPASTQRTALVLNDASLGYYGMEFHMDFTNQVIAIDGAGVYGQRYKGWFYVGIAGAVVVIVIVVIGWRWHIKRQWRKRAEKFKQPIISDTQKVQTSQSIDQLVAQTSKDESHSQLLGLQ